ncbi:MAG: SPOR domain-containing protein [Stenotrophomonas sp.]
MDNTLKQRLIGAIVLVALAVIFLPMLIKAPASDAGGEDISLRAPAPPADGQMQTRELPLVMPAPRAGGSVTGMPAAATADTPPAVAPARAAAGDFAVNYGAYANQADAQTVIASLEKAGLTAFHEPATINRQAAWRVRIGPFADRAAAESARLKAAALRADVTPQVVVLDGQGGEQQTTPTAPAPAPVAAVPTPAPAVPAPRPEPKPATPAPSTPAATVRPQPQPQPQPPKAEPPKAEQPAPAPAQPAAAAGRVGWVVQLGAFSNAAEANALRERMRAAGFSAFVEQVPTDHGSLSRVRVGPVASREAAEQLKAQLAARTGSSGMVRQHP